MGYGHTGYGDSQNELPSIDTELFDHHRAIETILFGNIPWLI